MSTTPEAQHLADCPFCGEAAAVLDGKSDSCRVRCEACGTEGRPSFFNSDNYAEIEIAEEEAIYGWNTRAQPPAPPVPAQPLTDAELRSMWRDEFDPAFPTDIFIAIDEYGKAVRDRTAARSVPEVPAAPSDALQHEAVPSAMDACEHSSGQDEFEGPYLCIAPACGDSCSGCARAISPKQQIEYAIAYAALRKRVDGAIAAAGAGPQGRMQAAKAAGSDDKRAALTESILALGTVEQTAPVIGLLVAYIESLAE